ncbi:DUF4652 domain-containing protein [Clostridium gasigenes]|uniref:DUF4652 domain-containing protein n=1 Tax=Clostridium gasigenes TaxID=94869 RepID=UPI001C0E6F76|nr:DUF4652 domain-containing protein [Clostridium gasigenes]MBU3106162.1 DUF4652 domain-containing protein [Clostridium gasigenes]
MKKFILSAIILAITSTLIFPPIVSHASETNIVAMSATNQNYNYKFEAVNPTNSISESFKTPLKQIDNTIYQASIVGRDITGREEGLSTVLIKNTKTNSYSEFKFKSDRQTESGLVNADTSLKVCSGIQDTLFIIVGYAYGRVTYGGSLYSLNIKTGETKLVSSPFNSLEQIVDAKISGNKLDLTLYLFDDNMMNHISYNRSIIY